MGFHRLNDLGGGEAGGLSRGDGEDGLREARLSHDMVYADPQAGDLVEVRAILGIVDRIAKVEGGA